MLSTRHDGLYGWVHCLRLGEYNSVRAPNLLSLSQYPAIIARPTFSQIVKNWNIADTSMTAHITFFVSTFAFCSLYFKNRQMSYFDRRR